MAKKKKGQAFVAIELLDYVMRVLIVRKGVSIGQAQLVEFPIPSGYIEELTIIDELSLFEFLKQSFSTLDIKGYETRIFVPDSSVLMKSFEHTDKVKTLSDLQEHVQMEIGHSIHLPFQDPLLAIYDYQPGDGKAMLFAAPNEEVSKWVNLLEDSHLEPEIADVRALANLRVLEALSLINEESTFLVASWSINAISICIYSEGQFQFLRYQTIETNLTDWTIDSNGQLIYSGEDEEYRMRITDQVLELERIMNFFRFSLHKGAKNIDELVLLGDNPLLEEIGALLRDNLMLPVTIADEQALQEKFPNFQSKHIALLGLALKGGFSG